jgi:Ca2+/Na+ antiporter
MEIGGLPAHILLIHGVVVLAPLAGLMAMVFALWRRSRTYLAWPLGVLALLMVPLSVLTAEAGEQLEDIRPASELIKEHAEQGSFFRFVTVIFLVVVAGQILAAFPSTVSRWPAFRGTGHALSARWLIPATSVLGVLAGLFLIYESVVTGHSGSASVWSGT